MEEHYTYERTAAKWMVALDAIPPANHEATWGSPPRLHTPAETIPEGMSDEQFVEWGMYQVAGRPELARSYNALHMNHNLSCGMPVAVGYAKGLFDRSAAYRWMRQMGEVKNHWEKRRCGL